MHFFIGLIFSSVLRTLAFADVDQAPVVNGQQTNVMLIAEPEAQSVAFTKKKKKSKSSKAKRHNKAMGKKFRRRNDDTLRRD